MELMHRVGTNGHARGLSSFARASDLRHYTIAQAPASKALVAGAENAAAEGTVALRDLVLQHSNSIV